MPKNIETGQLSWIEEKTGTLIGRAEIANIQDRIASNFSCSGCACGIAFKSSAMTPPSGSAGPGVIGYMFAPSVMKQDGHFTYGPYNPSSTITWSSTNTPVVTVDGAGNETTVAPGSATVLAQWSEVVGFNYACAAIYANVTASALCDVRPRIDSISPNRGLVGATVSVLIFGSGFNSNSTVAVSGYGVTVSGVNFLPSGVLTANFQMTPDATAGNHAVTVTTSIFTSDSVNFFVQKPSRLVRFDYPGAPNGYGPLTLTSNTNNEVRDVNGNVVPGFTNQCGVYRNLVYELKDQEGQPITQPFDITEAFSTYSGVASLPPNKQGHSSTGLLQDTMYFGKTLPDCPGTNDNESFDQRFFVTIGVTQYNLSTVVHVSRGRSSGNWFVDVTTTTP